MLRLLIATFLIGANLSSQAQTHYDVLNELRSNLKNSQFSDIRESVIPGIFEVQAGKNIIYYHQEKKLLIFGEIFTIEGKNLTSESRTLVNTLRLNGAHETIAISAGDPEAVNHIIEFTNLDCSACREYHSQIKGIQLPLKRSIILIADSNPQSRKKAEHLLCIKDDSTRVETDLNRIMHGDIFEYESCDEAEDLFKQHHALAQGMRIEGTPVLFVNNVRVEGPNLNQVRNLLIKEARK